MRELRYDARELAHALGFTERSFERLVKDEAGPSVGQWLRSLRAAEFRFRVRIGETLRKLAEDFGFKHRTDFTVEFRRWYKVSPRDYFKDFQKANPGVKGGN
jgi:AraC-like DNA-binding protein